MGILILLWMKRGGKIVKILIIGIGGAVFFLITAIINAIVLRHRKKRIDAMLNNEYEA